MVSYTNVLSLLPAGPAPVDNPPAGNYDTGREPENAPSFADRLDQRLTRPESRPEPRRPQVRRSDSPSDVHKAKTSDDTPVLSEAPASESASKSDEPETKADSDKSEDSDSSDDKAENKATPTHAAPSPLTPDALNAPAFLAAVAVVPITPIIPALNTAAPNVQATATTANSAAGLQNAALVLADTAKGASVASVNSPIIPIVATDSRAAILNAPGIANANSLLANLPSTSASIVNANAAEATVPDGLKPTTAGNTSELNGLASAVQLAASLAANTSKSASVSGDLSGANKATSTPAALTGTPQLATPQPAETAAAVIAPGKIVVAVPDAKIQASVMPPVGNAGARSLDQATKATPGAENLTQASATTDQDNAPAAASGKQNLGGIERLLTLNSAKTAEPVPEGVTKTVNATATPLVNAALNTPLLRSNSAVANTIAARNGVPGATNGIAANALPLGAATSTAGTNVTQTATQLVFASTESGKPVGVAQTLAHGVPGVLATANPVSPSAPSSAGIGAGNINSLVAFAQTATSAESSAGEQGQNEAQPQTNEQGLSSDKASANTEGVGTSTAFAPANSANDATVAAPTAAVTTNSSQLERAHVVEQVTRHLETMRLTNGGGEMRLRLNPHNLGSVQVTVSAHQDGVIARIAVESAQVQQAMEGAKEHLRAGLEARGLHVHSVEVTVTPNTLDSNSAAFSGQRNWQAPTAQDSLAWQPGYGRRSATSVEAAPIVAPATIAPRAILTDSRLDCRA